MRVPTRLALLPALLFVAAAPLGAQAINVPNDSAALAVTSPPVASDSAVSSAPNRGAAMTGLRAGLHTRETARPAAPLALAADRLGLGQARAMMIVGGAALFAGLIIGGDAGTIIAVGGAIIGLIGLYEYVQ
jgi:hypothetical protein